MAVLSGLKPEKVFCYFEKLCAVPHGSGNTKIISDLCAGFARDMGLKYRQDEMNNLVIWKDASPGYENAEPVILQGHMDMVCTKTEDCTKDMTKDGLDLATDGVAVWAEKTSLGGDDCIAVAMALAILSDGTLPHPPLEVIFTVDEETGMDGAAALDCSDIRGRKMINLDSEAEGIFTVSCAGGVRADCFLPGKSEALGDDVCYTVTVSGLIGGHSGAEIDKGRGSANVLMGRVLFSAMERLGALRLRDVCGGKFDNVISNLCDAEIAVPAQKAADFEAFISECDAVLKNEYAACDPGVTVSCAKTAFPDAMPADTTSVMLHTLFALPQGVQEMSRDFDGLVQTSLNLGILSMREDGLCFSCLIRSCIDTQKVLTLQKVRAIVTFAGGKVSTRSNYPGWRYKRDSAFRDLVLDIWKEQTGKDGIIEATHGGVECGLFVDKMPGLDVVSYGPDLRDIHSVNERLCVASAARVYDLTCELLRRSK